MPYDGAGTEREQAHRGKSLASNRLLLWTFSQQQSAAPVLDWKNQAIEILNEPGWAVADHGPLHGDSRTLKIRRDCSLTLFIDTEAARGRHFPRRAIPPGGARNNPDNVTLESVSGAKAILSAVDARTRVEGGDTARETARIHELTIKLPGPGPPAYTVEWLENLPSHFDWPNVVERVEGTEKTFSFTDNRIYATAPDELFGTGRHAAIIEAAGHKLYIWGPRLSREGPTPRSGCIIYEGAPAELTRKKFRTALSFAFGAYLVETGHTVFDKDWHAVSAAARSAYALGGRASELTVQPLMWLSDRNAEFDLGPVALTRMVERLFARYDDLDLPNLSWAYWHSRTAPPHIAPAHFGATIEALQDSYIKLHPGKFAEEILPKKDWRALRKDIVTVIEKAAISEDAKVAFKRNVQETMNNVPQRDILKSVCRDVGVVIGTDEDRAWKRRNDAAHGAPLPQEKVLPTIRDMKLLLVLFHRMLLAITGASDRYLDYATPGNPRTPIRLLKEPVPSAAKPADK
jgi:hypothetical protein